MTQPKLKEYIEARVKDTGDTMTGTLWFKAGEKYGQLFVDNQTNYCTYLTYHDSSTAIGQIMIQKDKILFSKYDGTWSQKEILHIGNIKNNLNLLFNFGYEFGNQTQDYYDFNDYRPGVSQIIWGGYIANSPWEEGSNHYGTLLTLGNTVSYQQQLLFDNKDSKIYYRNQHHGEWRDWQNLLTSTSGTAVAATKLATARTFSIADNDGNNVGPAISFNGTANIIINLPSTIKATLNGNASMATELSYFLTTNPSDNATGYRLLWQGKPGTWNNVRITFSISSRHNGNGIICLAFGCNAASVSASTIYGQIVYYGNNNNASNSTGSVFYKDMFQLYYNTTSNTFSLFAKYTDYSTVKLNILNSYSTSSGIGVIKLSNFSNGTYVSSIDTSTYGSLVCQTTKGWIEGDTITGAVWNDYAEYRDQEEEIEPGYCAVSADDGRLSKTTCRLQACDGIVSDTYGFAIGETENCRTPLAVAGRVLAYCEGSRYDYHAGDTVAAGPDGKVIKMTREEIKEYPDRIIGHVSEIPEYEYWGTGNISVNGRIWIKVK